ncbi:DUF3068 domain-containing protein [Corynebacterium sp. TA-R-1]|uniref:DUF3068 domain-containing protein n=1 Tax=Corynebacterium stercoris TaxID=2943490 RepID=A0ABT1G1J1_9CORY|nr:DUF3068 domain-containing protein [Corynebacterium stercoris]MCP1387893.1 DUF3068 domain-containing protein [Corynebacterium stercoris]
MQQRSRVLSTLLLGLGIALMVGGLVAPRFLLGDGRLPLSLSESTWTITDPDGLRDGQPAPVTHQLHMEIRNPSDVETASVRIGDTLRAGTAGTDFDNLVTASTWAYELDRVTGEATGPADVQLVMAMPAAEIPVEGAWLKFPANVEQRAYDVFDPVLRGAAPAQFVGEEEIAGRTVYTFRQEIPPTNIAQRYADMRNTLMVELPGDPETPEIPGPQIRTFLTHKAVRELKVDQVTGLVVGINEHVDDYYADATGRGIRNIVLYDGTMDRAQVETNVQALAGVSSQARSQAVTWAVMGLGALLTLLGLIGALRRTRRA